MGRALPRRLRGSIMGAILCGLVASPGLLAEQATPTGNWTGSIDVNGRPLGIEVSLAHDTAWKGTVSVPEQGAKDVPLVDIVVKGDSVVFGITGAMGQPTFRGTLQNGGKTLAGGFTQGGIVTTFTLARADASAKAAPATDPAKPAAAAKP